MGFSSAALAGLSGGLGVISKYAESEVKNQQELDLKKQIMAMEEEKALRMDEIKRQRDSAAAESERLASGQAIKDAQAANQAKTTENVAKENKAISGALNDVSQSQDPEVRGKLGAAAKLYADYESKSAKDRGLDEGTTGVINRLREAGRTKEANEFEQDRAREDGLERDKGVTARAEQTYAEQVRHNKSSESRQGAELALRQKEAKRVEEERKKEEDRAGYISGYKVAAANGHTDAAQLYRTEYLSRGGKDPVLAEKDTSKATETLKILQAERDNIDTTPERKNELQADINRITDALVDKKSGAKTGSVKRDFAGFSGAEVLPAKR